MQVAEAFRPGALTCETDDPLVDVARELLENSTGVLAVLDGNMIVGIISERDIARAVAHGTDTSTATAEMFATEHVETAKRDENTMTVARRMLDAGVRHLPVVQDSMVIGVISMRDVLAVEAWT
ncbi:CBS domain-containing protein [Actinopolyspora mzabensis]|uniref:CBS domain-containing protein n=1 Tax=Actinopolyspora mzabensis TaxID=995066 RepID=A0A1G9EHG8_ACTMZ|nr:CBS domain-containing protein [Actinopolyspora mzabensis]SDK75617.1 CBS domain-containing protein [Actinopolyspora mzabensis]